MRTFLLASLLLISNVLLAQYSSSIKNRPKPARVVNDYGSFLSGSERNRLEKELITYRQKSGNAIVIITLSTLPLSIEETALQYFNKWGIGDRVKNNGVLILLSRNPRGVRITTGIGVERTLTDYDCGRIIDQTIVPAFKEGNFYAGLSGGVNDIKHILGGGSTHRVYSGGQNYSSTDASPAQTETQTQAQPQTQPQAPGYVSSYEKHQYTPWEIIRGFLALALMVWLRVRYVRWKNPPTETYSTDGAVVTNENPDRVGEYVSATIWVFVIMFKIFWWCMIGVFALFGLMFGFGGGVLRGMGSSSSGAAASFGGGRSNGGGASGSW